MIYFLKSVENTGRRLAKDTRGNTAMIVAVAIFPLIAVVGGGLDIGRAHLVKSRLSQACDSAALAGRRAMSNENLATAKPEAEKFFAHNFPQGYMGTAPFALTITKPDVGVVKVAAATTVPTTLMRIFNQGNMPIGVECDATQNFDNIDIVLVLDTTGSMAENVSGTNVGDDSVNSKKYALYQAVMALYDELKPAQDQLKAQGLLLRYGVVPYSSTVNVGNNIRAVNSSYMVSDTHTYQSRVWVPSYRNSSGNTVAAAWRYEPVAYSMSSYVTGATLNTPTGANGTNEAMVWGGCIEERATDKTISTSSSTTSVPAGAYDLDVDLVPTANAATKWKPYMASSHTAYTSPVYNRSSSTNGSAPQKACPRAARNLAEMTRTEMDTYIKTLYSDGGTYHDIGMNWGNRFISSGGIFGPKNPETRGDRPVRKYIIFMTDGKISTGSTLYSAYGLEALDKRVSDPFVSNSALTDRHRQRFLIACNEAKKRGTSVYSIVFASPTEDSLSKCASNPDQYAVSLTAAELKAKFKEIGKNIGTLRLSK